MVKRFHSPKSVAIDEVETGDAITLGESSIWCPSGLDTAARTATTNPNPRDGELMVVSTDENCDDTNTATITANAGQTIADDSNVVFGTPNSWGEFKYDLATTNWKPIKGAA